MGTSNILVLRATNYIYKELMNRLNLWNACYHLRDDYKMNMGKDSTSHKIWGGERKRQLQLTLSYLALSFSAIASYFDFSSGSTSDHLLPSSLAISPTPNSGFRAFTLLRSSLQNQKNADLERSCEIMLISALYLSYDSDLC